MKILKIQKNKEGSYVLLLSNQEKIKTYDEVILKNNLLINKEIDNDLLIKIDEENMYYSNYKKVLKYSKIRLRSQKEINEYMKKLNFSKIYEEKTIQNLKKIGLYNDFNFVRAFISDKMYLTNWGPYKIKTELLKHDICEDIINENLEKISKEEIEEKLRKQLIKKCNNNHNTSSALLKKKLLFEFSNLGYDPSLILSILEEFTFNEEKNILEEYLKCKRTLEKKYSGEKLKMQIKQKLYRRGFSYELINQVVDQNDI